MVWTTISNWKNATSAVEFGAITKRSTRSRRSYKEKTQITFRLTLPLRQNKLLTKCAPSKIASWQERAWRQASFELSISGPSGPPAGLPLLLNTTLMKASPGSKTNSSTLEHSDTPTLEH